MKKRSFLTIATLGLLGLGAVLGGTNLSNTESNSIDNPSQVSQVQRKSTLEQLAKNGLPQEFKDMGFTVGEYVNRGTDKEVIILTENHDTKDLLKNKKKILKYLAKNYGVDSIGFESVSTDDKASYTLDERVSRDTDEIVEDLNKDHLNIKFFGIEDNSILQYLKYSKLWDPRSTSPSDEDIRGFLKKYPLPKNCPPEGIYYELGKPDRLKSFYGFLIRDRNIGISESTPMLLKQYNSRIAVIILGANHVNFPIKEIRNIQDNLPFSYLIINGPEAGKKYVEKYLKEDSERYNLDYDSFIAKIKSLEKD
jgi:hypothetical protein